MGKKLNLYTLSLARVVISNTQQLTALVAGLVKSTGFYQSRRLTFDTSKSDSVVFYVCNQGTLV